MDTAEKILFGTMPDGTPVEQYTLHAGAISCDILTYGGALRALRVPDRQGNPVDVLLGFDSLEDYCKQDKYLCALIGRYGNRIGDAAFTLNGKKYKLAANNGQNHLHGGNVGFDRQVWQVKSAASDTLVLGLVSPDGQEGYPGTLTVQVTYRLAADGLEIQYQAKTTADTLCNLTNHAYFNLAGHASGPVTAQEIQIFADRYTPTDGGSIPTGELADVEGTPMDLRQLIPIGTHIDKSFAQLKLAHGYDHNWAVNGEAGILRPAAKALCRETGIVMDTLTTQPGIQFYSGNYLDGCPAGKNGAPYAFRWGFCLETQGYPDSPNKPNFPSTVLHPGEIYNHTTVYRFGIEE